MALFKKEFKAEGIVTGGQPSQWLLKCNMIDSKGIFFQGKEEVTIIGKNFIKHALKAFKLDSIVGLGSYKITIILEEP